MPTVNKKDIAREIASMYTGLTIQAANNMMTDIFDIIKDKLDSDVDVRIKNFGKFYVSSYSADTWGIIDLQKSERPEGPIKCVRFRPSEVMKKELREIDSD